VLPSGPTLRHVLVIGVDGVRFDLVGPEVTPVIWAVGRDEPEVTMAWAAAAGPGIVPGGPPLITRQTEVAPLVLAALGGQRGEGHEPRPVL
jgi:hypothetical protein